MKILILTLCHLIAIAAIARITDTQVESKITDNRIELSVKPGFHFNIEAPANARFDDLKAIFRPNPKTEKLLVYTAPVKTKKAKLSFYVCDDNKTACEQHEMNISLSDRNPSEQKPEAKPNESANIKSDKPTLLIFSAPWCPACLRMQSETFPVASVANQFKKLKIQKINIDLPANSEIADTYHVKAIPTLVLLNKNGEEVHRWVDYQPAKKFASDLQVNIKNVVSISELEKKAAKGDAKSISQLGMQAYLAYNCQDAMKWWEKSKDKADTNLRLAAEVQCSEDKAPAEQIKILENAIKQSTSKLDQVRWSVDLLEKKKETKAGDEVAPDVLLVANKTLEVLAAISKNSTTLKQSFVESTFGEAAGFETEEVLYLKSKIYNILEKAPEKAQALEAIKANAEKRNISVDRPGEMLMAIAYLREANEKVRVQEMYQQLLNKYPDTYVYHEKYARYQLKNKNYDQALASVNLAIQFPEGNLPKLNLLKARVLKEMKSNEQAVAVINAALLLPDISHKKFKKTLTELETLKKEIETQ